MVKYDQIRRIPAHDFLSVGFISQNSRTNNKRVILKVWLPLFDLEGGVQGQI